MRTDPAFVDLAKVIIAETIHSPHRINEALAEVEERDGNLSSWIVAAIDDGALKAESFEQLNSLPYSKLSASGRKLYKDNRSRTSRNKLISLVLPLICFLALIGHRISIFRVILPR
jgi:hypothetical protein